MRLYIASGTASATGTINDNDAAPTVATITPASATEGSPAVFEFSLSNPSAVIQRIPLHSPMEPLEVLITLPQRYSNRTCGCYYGNCSCTNNC
jgi:hypothetical protein